MGNRIEQNQLTESEGLGQLFMEDRDTLGFGVLGCKRGKVNFCCFKIFIGATVMCIQMVHPI